MAENGAVESVTENDTEHPAKRTSRSAAAKKARETRVLRSIKVPDGLIHGGTLYVEGEQHKAEHKHEKAAAENSQEGEETAEEK